MEKSDEGAERIMDDNGKKKKRRIRPSAGSGTARKLIGAALIVISVVAMYFWESGGRDSMTLVDVVAVSRDVSAGERLAAGDLKILRVRPGNVLKGSFVSPRQAIGLYALSDMVENQQVLASYLGEEKEEEKAPGTSVFALRQEWIFSRSASLGSGDEVDIYAVAPPPEASASGEAGPESAVREGPAFLGRYRIAGVFDSVERRAEESGAAICSVEIYCTLSEFMELCEIAEGRDSGFLLLCEVLEGGKQP